MLKLIFIYASGVIVSYAICIITLFIKFLYFVCNHTKIKKVEESGKKYNWIDNTYYIDSNNNVHVLKSLIRKLKLPLLSWLYIIMILYVLFHGKGGLSKRQVNCLKNKLMCLMHNDFENRYLIENGYNRDVYYTVKKNTTHWEWSKNEWLSLHENCISQYKIKGTKIYEKTLNDREEISGKNDKIVYFVMDGAATREYLRPGETMKNREDGTIWHELTNMQYIPYILYNYDKLSDNDFKNYLTKCIKNINQCWEELKKFYNENGIEYKKDVGTYCKEGEGLYFTSYEKFRKGKDGDRFYHELEEILKKYNCIGGDFSLFMKEGENEEIEPRILALYKKFFNDDI